MRNSIANNTFVMGIFGCTLGLNIVVSVFNSHMYIHILPRCIWAPELDFIARQPRQLMNTGGRFMIWRELTREWTLNFGCLGVNREAI